MNKYILGALAAGCLSVTMLSASALAVEENVHDGAFDAMEQKATFQTDYRMTKHVLYDEQGNQYCTEEYFYDIYGNRVKSIITDSDGVHIDWYIHTYDANGNITSSKLNCDKYHKYAADSMVYTYNSSKQLETEILKTDGQDSHSKVYKYDANGNVTNDGYTEYTYDANNRLTKQSNADETTVYEYNEKGDLTKTTLTTEATEEGATVHTYNNEYDSNGKLTRQTEYNGNVKVYIKEFDANGNEVSCSRNSDSSSDTGTTWTKETFEYKKNNEVSNVKTVNPFNDVYTSDWFYDTVMWAYENDITNGVESYAFGSEQTCTRAQAVTFLWRMSGSPKAAEGTANPFSDVQSSSYYYDAVLWAVDKGIVKGVSETSFAPDASCTRQECVTFFMRASGDDKTDASNPFTDVDDSMWSYDAILWAIKNNITNGMSDKEFIPTGNCSRAQYVTFASRYMNYKK